MSDIRPHPERCPNCAGADELSYERLSPECPGGEYVCWSCGWSMVAMTGEIKDQGVPHDGTDYLKSKITRLEKQVGILQAYMIIKPTAASIGVSDDALIDALHSLEKGAINERG